jgi:hypothetical protein
MRPCVGRAVRPVPRVPHRTCPPDRVQGGAPGPDERLARALSELRLQAAVVSSRARSPIASADANDPSLVAPARRRSVRRHAAGATGWPPRRRRRRSSARTRQRPPPTRPADPLAPNRTSGRLHWPADKDTAIAVVGTRTLTLGDLVDHLDGRHHPGFREALTVTPTVEAMLRSDLMAPWVRHFADLEALRQVFASELADAKKLEEATSGVAEEELPGLPRQLRAEPEGAGPPDRAEPAARQPAARRLPAAQRARRRDAGHARLPRARATTRAASCTSSSTTTRARSAARSPSRTSWSSTATPAPASCCASEGHRARQRTLSRRSRRG